MNVRSLLLTLALLCPGFYIAHSQQRCATDEIHRDLMQKDSAYARATRVREAKWAQTATVIPNGLVVNTSNGPVYEIPVVVHVMHANAALGTLDNPTDATIVTYINYLNKTYEAQWTGYADTTNGGVKIPIKFVLAKRAPSTSCNGVATTGINRVNVSAIYPNYTANGINRSNWAGVDDSVLKSLSSWPSTDYYNIWMVNYIDGPSGGVGGYAYYPGAPAWLDGTVILARYATPYSNGTYYYAVPHELGHAFGLPHTFEGDGGGSFCPSNFNCTTDGDGVCDTEPHINLNNSVCASGTNPCTGLPYAGVQYNFMNYTACPNRFTAGQRTKVLFNLFNYRPGLLQSMGTTPPATATAPTAACIPGISAANVGNNYEMGPTEISLADFATNSHGYSNDGYKAYLDRTCTQLPAHLAPGTTYTLSVNTVWNEQTVVAWIDYNNDGVFQNSEKIMSHIGTLNDETHTGTFTVPLTGATTCTALRMRIIADYAGSPVPQACTNVEYGQTEDYSVIVQAATTAPTINIAASATTVCSGTSVTYTATVTNAGTSPVYQWKRNGAVVGTNSATYTLATPTNGDMITCELTTTSGCTSGTVVTVSNTIAMVVNSAVLPTISIAATPSGAICAGTNVTFNASITNGGATPAYQWKKNGTNIATGSSMSASNLLNGDVITCVLTSNASCASPATATSGSVTMVVSNVVTPTVSVTSSATGSICQGTSVTFTATGTNTGTTPFYQWKVNGINAGTNSSTYTSTSLANNDVVTCVLTSNLGCVTTATVTSNAITTTVIPAATASVSITASASVICTGATVTFTATPVNGGAAPGYQWKRNGVNIGTSSPAFSSNVLANGDIISCVMTTSQSCTLPASATSNSITMTVNTTLPVSVSITAPGTAICAGTSVPFTATAVNGGTTPVYQWKINGSNTGTNSPNYSSSTLVNGDVVTCLLTSSNTCASPATAASNALTMTVSPVVTPAISITSTQTGPACAGTSIVFSSVISNGGPLPVYQWKVNGINVPATTATYTTATLNNNDIVTCELTGSATCGTSGPVLSNAFTASVIPVTTPSVTIAVSPNDTICAGTPVLFDANPSSGGTNPVFQWKKNGINVGTNSQTYTAATVNNGDIITVEMTSNATCITTPNVIGNVVHMYVHPRPTPVITLAGNILSVPTGYTNYQWFLNGVSIPGANSNSWIPVQNGLYTVGVVDGNGCGGNTASFTYTGVGVGEITAANKVTVYPNPAQNIVFIKAAVPINAELYSMEGRLLLKIKDARQVDISQYADGIYQLRLRDPENILIETVRITKSTR